MLPEPLIVFLRGIFAFFSLLILTRSMGNKQISQLTLFDYITGITICSIAASLTVDLSTQAIPTWTGLLTWTLGTLILGVITVHSRNWRVKITGEPTVVIQNGKILESNLERLNYSIDDLRAQLRELNAFNIADVEFAVLEPNGKLSVLKKSQLQPLTPADLQIPTDYKGLPTELIMDGHIIHAILKWLNLSEQWLRDQIAGRNLRIEDVYYAEIDTQGNLYVDLRDNLDHVPKDQDGGEADEPKETDQRRENQ